MKKIQNPQSLYLVLFYQKHTENPLKAYLLEEVKEECVVLTGKVWFVGLAGQLVAGVAQPHFGQEGSSSS